MNNTNCAFVLLCTLRLLCALAPALTTEVGIYNRLSVQMRIHWLKEIMSGIPKPFS